MTAQTLAEFDGPLLLAGAGKMGQAMLEGWLARGLEPKKLVVIEPQPVDSVQALAAKGAALNPAALPKAGAIVIAVKPQTAPEAVPPLAAAVARDTLVLSIMAGRTLASLRAHMPAGTALVRAMPNTPAAIGRGITVACGSPEVTPAQRALASGLLEAIGSVEWVEDESLMDAV